MKHLARFCSCALVGLVASSACGVDERPLTYEYRQLEAAGSSASAGRGSVSGSSGDGDAGALAAGKTAQSGSGGACASCGGNGDAGSPLELGGDAGSANPSGGAGAGSAGTAIGGSYAGGGANTAGAGRAGGAVVFPCGDLNQDSIDDCQQTLVLNSRFDSAVSGWDLEPSTTRVWDANNASGEPGSGSLQVSNVLPVEQAVGVVLAGSRQCIPITPLTNYDFGANVMLAPGQAAGQAGLNVWLFDDDACAGNLVTGNTPIAGGQADKWTALKGKLWIPAGVHSMYVRLVAIKPFAQASLSVFIDDVLVAKR